MLLKQSLTYLILSILVVIFASYVHLGIVYVDLFYTFINVKLAPVFSNSALGTTLRQILTLTIIPIFIAAIPALTYRTIKGKHMPYFMEVSWLIWLVIVLSKILIR